MYAQDNILCQFGLFRHKFTTISPPILNHFRWELYHNTLEDSIRFRGAMTKLKSDYAKVEISNKVKDILRMYHSSSWNTEPYHQNQNPAGGRYCTLKSWTNTIMNRSGAPAGCWLLCMRYASYILNHLSCEVLADNVPLGMLYGVSPDISIILL